MADGDVVATHDVMILCRDCKKRVPAKMIAVLQVSIRLEPRVHCATTLLRPGCDILREDLEAFVTKMRDGLRGKGLVSDADAAFDATDAWKKLSS